MKGVRFLFLCGKLIREDGVSKFVALNSALDPLEPHENSQTTGPSLNNTKLNRSVYTCIGLGA